MRQMFSLDNPTFLVKRRQYKGPLKSMFCSWNMVNGMSNNDIDRRRLYRIVESNGREKEISFAVVTGRRNSIVV